MADRKPTPGAGQYSVSFDDEEPTLRSNPRPDDRWDTLARLLYNLTPEERRQLMLLADRWYLCDAEGRALLGALAAKLSD